MRSFAITQFRSLLAITLLVAMVGALAACQPRQREYDTWTTDSIELNVRASDRNILAGQVVVFSADARNVLGRDVRIEWDAPGGEVTTEDGGHIARVQYNRPGTYVVVSHLYVNGDLHRTDTKQVTVRPVN